MKNNYIINFNKINIDAAYITPEYMTKIDIYNNLFNNPETTFYFKGFKIITIKTDINVIRNIRAISKNFKYPKAVADIIMSKKLINSSIEIPINIEKLNKEKQNRVLKAIKRRYNSNYNPFDDKTLKL